MRSLKARALLALPVNGSTTVTVMRFKPAKPLIFFIGSMSSSQNIIRNGTPSSSLKPGVLRISSLIPMSNFRALGLSMILDQSLGAGRSIMDQSNRGEWSSAKSSMCSLMLEYDAWFSFSWTSGWAKFLATDFFLPKYFGASPYRSLVV